MVRRMAVAGVICTATWIIEVPLAASVAHLERGGQSAGPTCWFLVALSAGLIMRALYPSRFLRTPASLIALGVNVAATLLARGALQPAGYVLMGLATGAGLPAAPALMETLLDSAWTGRLVAVTVGGVTLVHWGLDLVREVLPFLPISLLVLLFLVAGWGAMSWAGIGKDLSGTATRPHLITTRPTRRTAVSVGLFVLLFALIGGISARFMLGTAAVLTLADLLLRLLFIGGLAAGTMFLERGQTIRIAVAAAALLVAAFLADQLRWGAGVPLLSASAFGVLEPIPWFVLARLAATSPRARPWADAAAALFVLRFGIAIPITARIDEHMLVLLGLPGALALLLALILVPDLLSLQSETVAPALNETRSAVAASLAHPDDRRVDTGRLLAQFYGDRLSPRELEIGSLAIAGISTREIAERLYLTENTVKYHLKNLFRKTGAENRHDLYRKLVAANHAEKK